MTELQEQRTTIEADPTTLSASEIAAQIRTGALSAEEAVQAHIARIEAVNPALNAVVFPLFEQACSEARSADAAQARGEPLGPLHGVPITIRANLQKVGQASSA